QFQEALQALLAIAASLNSSPTQNGLDNQNQANNQTIFLKLFTEDISFCTLQLGCSSNTLDNLKIFPNSISSSSPVVISEDIVDNILQLIPLNYVCKEISLPSQIFKDFPLLVYYKVLTPASKIPPSNKTLDSNKISLTTLFYTQQDSLKPITYSNKIVSLFIKGPN
ncbi:10976_t:CDS:2, partial [Dentiscutata heterogama]